MDAVLLFSSILLVVIVIAALGTVFGVDSRDGFADERLRSGLS